MFVRQREYHDLLQRVLQGFRVLSTRCLVLCAGPHTPNPMVSGSWLVVRTFGEYCADFWNFEPSVLFLFVSARVDTLLTR